MVLTVNERNLPFLVRVLVYVRKLRRRVLPIDMLNLDLKVNRRDFQEASEPQKISRMREVFLGAHDNRKDNRLQS